MRKTFYFTLMSALLVTLAPALAAAESEPSNAPAAAADAKPEVALENLLKADLEVTKGIEIIVSRVTVPPNTSLPKHWHPGEEFGYVLEGSVVLWQKGKDDIVTKKGDVVKIPLKQIHTAITKDEGATLLVFRIHEKGKPERVLAE
jgi:quercetin dioxygenase-like cupin family protein